ncbi:hypothetical protein XbC2_357 [Xanthomonas phage XbC2]|nr:hypothetical protein XbC2_357 [Xanthomonas phage XbC2]
MSVPNMARVVSQILAQSIPSDTDIPVYCVIRMTSSHRGVDEVIGVYFDKEKADKACEDFKATLQKRSRSKVYVQTSVLGK